MKNSGETLLVDIDATLDQLIRNADALNRISDRHLFTSEIKAMHRTQDNLIMRLMHMHELYESEQTNPENGMEKSKLSRIENKLTKFGKLNARMISFLEDGLKKPVKVKVRPRRMGRKAIKR